MAVSATIQSMPPSPIRWSKSLYHEMANYGLFRDKRVQLIEGEIIEMAPMGTQHWVVVNTSYRTLIQRLPLELFTIAIQCPIDLGSDSEPEPDIAVIKGVPSEFASALPTAASIHLVIEVSDSSLAFDRERKCRIYATAGIVEYWVIDVAGRTVEVYREPIISESRYRTVSILDISAAVTPLFGDGIEIPIRDLFG
jgi:Uma2 family endonuclease